MGWPSAGASSSCEARLLLFAFFPGVKSLAMEADVVVVVEEGSSLASVELVVCKGWGSFCADLGC